MASNWLRTVVYKNATAKLLSLDLNVKKKKLYWFEFNLSNKRWSIGVKQLNRLQHMPPAYYTFDAYSALNMFANDGYTFIAVALDNSTTVTQTRLNNINTILI